MVVFDLETTGLDITKDRIIEIGLVKIETDGSESELCLRINPEKPIPAESSAIHGITDEDVKDKPKFSEVADEIATFIGNADLAGYNSNKFDVPVLAEEFLRCEHTFSIHERKLVDVQNIFHKMEQRTLAAAFQFYCGEKMDNAHNALYDTKVTLSVLKAQMAKYEELPKEVEQLSVFSRQGDFELCDFAGRLAYNKERNVTYNFGKHKGKTVEEVMKIEPGYYGWMMDADFPLYTKQCLKREMTRIKEKGSTKASDKNLTMEEKLAALQSKFTKK